MANDQNLKPWKPGQSGNPSGYSTGRRVTDRLAKLLEERNLDDTLALIWYGVATGDEKILGGRKPDYRFFKELLDRIDGPVVSKVETSTTQAANDHDDLDDAAIDAWAEQRVQAAARRRHREALARGPGVGDVEPAMEVGASPGGPESPRPGDGEREDTPAPDHDAT